MFDHTPRFEDRADAARRLAVKLKGRSLHKPVVLGIPRGGVVTAAILARELGADLDVALSRKLRAPYQSELAIGSISEDGKVYLTNFAQVAPGVTPDYLTRECELQMSEIARRRQLFRAVKPIVSLRGRSVIVTDDGIATGATMIAALQSAKVQKPKELIVAAPVAAADRLNDIKRWCDEVICLISEPQFEAIGQFYEDFSQVEDDEVVELLRSFSLPTNGKKGLVGSNT
jgi:predicted phosphoribosyltransferase